MPILISCCVCGSAFTYTLRAQKPIYDSLTQKHVYTIAHDMPYYSAHDRYGANYIVQNFDYFDEQNPQVSFVLQFVIDSDGSVIGARIKDKCKCEVTVAERKLLDVIEKMPKWIPGKISTKSVPVMVYLPIEFSPNSGNVSD